MNTVSTRKRECSFLNTLSLHQQVSSSYVEHKTVNRVHHASFQDACPPLRLVADDAEWRNALWESYASSFHPITELFALILAQCEPSNPLQL